MREVQRNDACPCCSGLKYKKCCGPALDGVLWPATPEALMRSRYTAYATGHAEHLYRTAHSENETVKGVDRARFLQETLSYCRALNFSGLTVHESFPPDAAGGVYRVRFTAAYTVGGQAHAFTELSDFMQVDGRWLYRSGAAQE